MSLNGQSRRSVALGANDPRSRRSAQGFVNDATLVKSPLFVDNDGKMGCDTSFVSPLVLTYKRTAVTANYAIRNTDQIIAVTSTAAARTITLPNASGIEGQVFIIKDESGACSTHNITVATTNSQTIDGAATVTMANDYECLWFYSTGTGWAVA